MDKRFRQAPRGFALHLHALEEARRSLERGAEGAESSVRRLVRALAADSRLQGFHDLNALAEKIPEVAAPELSGALSQLLAAVPGTPGPGTGPENVIVLVQRKAPEYDVQPLLDTEGRRIVRCHSASAAEEALAEGRVDLVVLDLDLPDNDGREFLVRHWERSHGIHLPLFVVSSDTSTMTMLECLALGATAFFGLPLDGAVVAARVDRALEKDRTRRESDRYDPVTGLENRRAFAEAYEEMLAAGNGSAPPVTLGVLEVVELEHDGERTLLRQDEIRSTAQRLNRLLDGHPVIARLSGNELGLLVSGADPQEVGVMLQAARQEIEARLEEAPDGEAVHLSFSGGLVLTTRDTTLRDAMTEADRRLQAAKVSESRLVVESPERAGPWRVLLTEDDRLMAKLTIHRLEHEGYEVFHFDNGVRAFQQAVAVKPDMMVLDVNMPGLDGMTLLEQLRAHPDFTEVPILMLTALARDGDKVRAFHLGANDYLTKPFSAAELVARVGHLVSEREQHRH